MNEKDREFILSLIVDWAKDCPVGLCPTMYGTGTREGDLEVQKEVYKILNVEHETNPSTDG